MRTLFFFFALLLSFSLFAQEQQPRYSRVRIHAETPQQRQQVQALGLDCQHGHHRPGAYFENDFSEQEIQLLDQAGVRYEILIHDVAAHYQAQNEGPKGRLASPWDADCGPVSFPYNTPSNFHLGSMGGFLNYTELMAELDSMAARYPQLITRRAVIDSSNPTHQGRYLYWVKISDNPNQAETEPQALFTALHHSREPLSAMQLVYFMWFLLENYQNSPEIRYLVDNTELFFIPCVNPDGYVYNQQTNPNGGGLWRKNRRNNGGSFGVDLNRNYGYAFAFDNTGSSGVASSDTYRGPAPFSEPETQNIRSFCNAHNFQIALNYHSYGNMLIYPWAYNSAQTPDSTAYREFARLLTRQNRFITGTNAETVGYSSNGDADDWFYGEQTQKNKILSMTPEAGYQDDGFWPASSKIEYLCQLNLWQNLRYAQCLLNFGEVYDRSSPFIARSNVFMPFQVKRFGYQSGNLRVSLRSASPYVLSIGAGRDFRLNQFQAQTDSIEVLISPTTPNGTVLPFLLDIDNGFYRETDTLYKLFGSLDVPFLDSANSMANWQNLGTGSAWGLTTSTFYSAPSCITDSPTGNYPNNQRSELLLLQNVDLSQAAEAHLSFWAKWDLEDDYDYVQVLAADSTGVFVPLCGLYTNSGTADQDLDKPLYDGIQSTWVQEVMPLADFIGKSNVNIKIRLRSDAALRRDGFYFDDFSVNVVPVDTTVITGQWMEQLAERLGQSQPNPARTQVYIPIHGQGLEASVLEVSDVLGRVVWRQVVAQGSLGLDLDVSQWAQGMYFYRIVQGNLASQPQKMVIER